MRSSIGSDRVQPVPGQGKMESKGNNKMNSTLNRNIRVLLVEDDLATSKILGSLLHSFDYEVRKAGRRRHSAAIGCRGILVRVDSSILVTRKK